MLHNIRDIHLVSFDPRLGESVIKYFSCGPNEWSTLTIFLIPGLFTHEHDRSSRLSLAEDGLCSGLPEIARLAHARLLSQELNRPPLRREAGTIFGGLFCRRASRCL